ncbi:MAG: Kelch repeat-containing protein [Planctomycetota bacterium]|jgi:N-acetylneuraminic acid mutarotase
MKTVSKALTRFAEAALLLLLSFTLVGQAAGQSWSLTGNLNEPRSSAATLLLDGRVLIAAGNGVSSVRLKTAELYDPATGSWTPTGSLSEERDGVLLVRLLDGRVLLCGGRNARATLRGAEVYDPATGAWTRTGDMHDVRVVYSATLLPNGKVLVAGGYGAGFLRTAEIYDPATGNWSRTGNMSIGRWQHAAVLLPDGRVLVAGGENYSFRPTTGLRSTEIYDPGTGTWSAASDLNVPRAVHTANVLLDGTVLVSGGVAPYEPPPYWRTLGRDSAEIYDPASDTWILTGSLSDFRASHSSTLLMDGTVLVAGGMSIVSEPPDPRVTVATTELYDATTGSWTLMDDLNEARHSHVAILLCDGSVLVAGGYDGTQYLNTAEIFRAQLAPDELVVLLGETVIELNLQNGIANSLDAKLDAVFQALADLNENNDVAAVNALEAFINSVEAQSGNRIPAADADGLIAAALEIILLLSCG